MSHELFKEIWEVLAPGQPYTSPDDILAVAKNMREELAGHEALATVVTNDMTGQAFSGVWAEPMSNMELATFPNPHPERDYVVNIEAPEFTCLCPKTGQPDFATVSVRYIPGEKCVELKSWKLYLWSFRQRGAFHETVANEIATKLLLTLEPRELMVTMQFWTRGGISTTVTVGGGSDAYRQSRDSRNQASSPEG